MVLNNSLLRNRLLFTCYGYPRIPNCSFGFEFLQQLPQISVISGKERKVQRLGGGGRILIFTTSLHLGNEPQVGSSFHKSIHLSQFEFGHVPLLVLSEVTGKRSLLMRGTGVCEVMKVWGQPEDSGNTQNFCQEGSCVCTMPVVSELNIRYPPWDQKNFKKGKSNWGWCTGTTQRDGMGREEGGGFKNK